MPPKATVLSSQRFLSILETNGKPRSRPKSLNSCMFLRILAFTFGCKPSKYSPDWLLCTLFVIYNMPPHAKIIAYMRYYFDKVFNHLMPGQAPGFSFFTGAERMKLYTVREVAAILHKRQAFVRAEIAAGRLAAVRLGPRGTRISEEALREYITKMVAYPLALQEAGTMTNKDSSKMFPEKIGILGERGYLHSLPGAVAGSLVAVEMQGW